MNLTRKRWFEMNRELSCRYTEFILECRKVWRREIVCVWLEAVATALGFWRVITWIGCSVLSVL